MRHLAEALLIYLCFFGAGRACYSVQLGSKYIIYVYGSHLAFRVA